MIYIMAFPCNKLTTHSNAFFSGNIVLYVDKKPPLKTGNRCRKDRLEHVTILRYSISELGFVQCNLFSQSEFRFPMNDKSIFCISPGERGKIWYDQLSLFSSQRCAIDDIERSLGKSQNMK
ncbi:hypothetical protein TNIN_376431 [Trichonephila inaurata madagascariensis]|uniref:Uncharacterized protein n=1 Tax=Trichonephila inaurata madagascariensis TaxID=2747483 RepID=A0A8X7BWY2_9ARAC|nr:hypothetical protein TNIN_376431 [Trichonephila inaurata madagascariensis]